MHEHQETTACRRSMHAAIGALCASMAAAQPFECTESFLANVHPWFCVTDAVVDDHLLFAMGEDNDDPDFRGDVWVLDISDPTDPVFLAAWGMGTVYGLIIEDDIGYAQAGIWTHLLDLSNPLQPEVLGTHRQGNFGFSDVDVERSFIYGVDNTEEKLFVLDATDPTSPIIRGSVSIPTNARDIEVADNVAFIGYSSDGRESGGLAAVNIADPDNPVFLGQLSTDIPITQIDIQRNVAYCDTFRGPLIFIDVSDPTAPIEIARFDVDPGVNSIKVVGDKGYVSSVWGVEQALRIYDLRDLQNPVLIARYTQDRQYLEIGVAGTIGILRGISTVTLVDLTNCRCLADRDFDNDLDSDDFFLFLELFADGHSGADIDGDGDLDAKDFFGFLDLFQAGCD